VWEALRDQLPALAALFHSVGLLEGGREYEADLVVAWPGVGIAVIEVKGGRVTREAGQWWQNHVSGGRDRIDPVRQAQDCRHVLSRLLTDRNCAAERARTAHLVAFPYTTVPSEWEAPDCPRGMVLDSTDMDNAANAVAAAVRSHGGGWQLLDGGELECMVDVLEGQLVGQMALLSAAEEHEDRAGQLTRDQFRALDAVQYHRRLKVLGGAGSGKTFLALEQARRLGSRGERVALVCYSRGLARFLARTTMTWPKSERPAYVGLFHDLPIGWGAERGADDDSDYYERRLPFALGELARAQPPSQLFDSIVVDEGQDFGELWWPPTLDCLRDADGGGLFVFLDEAQRVFRRSGEVPIPLPPYLLTENVRNTKSIANVFRSLSHEKFRIRGLDGPPVRFHVSRPEEAVSAADDEVEALLDEGWAAGQVALLTTYHRHLEQCNAIDFGGWDGYWDAFFLAQDIFYGHVLGFKGLERSVVVLAVNGFRDTQRARELLYVGLSRARSLLVVCGDLAEIAAAGGEGVRHRLAAAEQR
jgi:Nuclease-related domain/UvrD-like helicase C-terminal domain